MARKMLIIGVVIIVLLIVAGSAAYVFLSAPKKYSIELWYNSDGHYGSTEAALATTLKNSIESCGKVTGHLDVLSYPAEPGEATVLPPWMVPGLLRHGRLHLAVHGL